MLSFDRPFKNWLKILASVILSILILGSFPIVTSAAQKDLAVDFAITSSSTFQVKSGSTMTINYTVENKGTEDSNPQDLILGFATSGIGQNGSTTPILQISNIAGALTENPVSSASFVPVVDITSFANIFSQNSNISNTNSFRVLSLESMKPSTKVTFSLTLTFAGSNPYYCDLNADPLFETLIFLANPGKIQNGAQMQISQDRTKISIDNPTVPDINNALGFDFDGNTVTIADGLYAIDDNINNNFNGLNMARSRFCMPDIVTTSTANPGEKQLKPDTESIVYNVKIKNKGNFPAQNVVLQNTLSACLEYLTLDSSLQKPDNVIFSISGQNLNFTVTTLSPNQEIEVSFTPKIKQTPECKITPESGFQLMSNALTKGNGKPFDTFDAKLADNAAVANTYMDHLILLLNSNKQLAKTGENIEYTLSLENLSDLQTAHGGSMIITLPSNLSFFSGDPSLVLQNNQLIWNDPSVPGKTKIAKKFILQVKNDIQNSAAVGANLYEGYLLANNTISIEKTQTPVIQANTAGTTIIPNSSQNQTNTIQSTQSTSNTANPINNQSNSTTGSTSAVSNVNSTDAQSSLSNSIKSDAAQKSSSESSSNTGSHSTKSFDITAATPSPQVLGVTENLKNQENKAELIRTGAATDFNGEEVAGNIILFAGLFISLVFFAYCWQLQTSQN